MEKNFEHYLKNSKGEPLTDTNLAEIPIKCLFFTAFWCNPSKIFQEELLKIYEEVNEGDKLMEVFLISFDEESVNFNKSTSNKPWLSLGYQDPHIKELKTKFKVTEVPQLVVLDKDHNVVELNGRSELALKGAKVVEDWLERVNYKYY